MGNKTTVKDVGIGGAFACLIVGVLGFYQPDLMNSVVGAESALTVILTAGFAYLKPAQ